jgi:Cof subfamily protein (haloacid dehalogenase superfamily)
MLVFDGDGTALCEKHAVPQSTIDAVQLLYEAGKFSTLCTGRCVQGALPIARRMNLRPLPLRHGPGILFGALNGGVIVDLEGRVIKEVRLGARRTAQVIEILQRRHLSIWLQTANDWFVLGGYDRCVQHEIDVLGTRPIYLNPNARLPLSETVKVAAVSWDPAALVGLSDSLKTFLGDGASVAQSHPKEVDGTHARANKGAFVRLVRRLTGIRRRHTATIGDMHNDLPMFLESEIAIAMGNAPAEVQARATHTAPRNSEGGFGWAVRHIVLPHR